MEGRIIVARPHDRIARVKATGHSTLDHEQTLDVLESTQRIFEEHERGLRVARACQTKPLANAR